MRRGAPRPILPVTSENINSRIESSQTVHSPGQSASGSIDEDTPTPKNVQGTSPDAPVEEPHDRLTSIGEATRRSQSEERPHTVTSTDTMQPPPIPPKRVLAAPMEGDLTRAASDSSLPRGISPEESQQALEVVMSFAEQQETGFLSFQEIAHIGKLAAKIHDRVTSSTTTGKTSKADRNGLIAQ